jgi:hypothetical protein
MKNAKCKVQNGDPHAVLAFCILHFAFCILHFSRRPPLATRHTPPAARRGSTYLIVLATASIVATMGLGALLAVRAQARAVNVTGDAAEARQYALSAIEIGRLWIAQDPNWRTNRTFGTWANQQAIGSGTFTLAVSDPRPTTDPWYGNLAYRPHDPVVLKATGVKGQARQVIQVTLSANPVPLPALQYALATGGQLHVKPGYQLATNLATVSTNGDLKNHGTIAGNVEAASASQVGTISGTLTLNAPPKAFPSHSVVDLYTNLGTLIAPGNTIDKQLLSPGQNPWGATNPEGVYVIRTNSDLTISNSRIYGTLVVLCSGHKVTMQNQVLFQPVRADYPTLIVDGNAVFQYSSQGTVLSEATTGVNFNPPGTPYNGQSDSDLSDTYPSEIQGLVHVTGTVQLNNTALIRGLLLCQSTLASDAVVCQDSQVIYTPSLYTFPPQGYTTAVNMILQSGSLQQVVN